jgi:hypothetical protein
LPLLGIVVIQIISCSKADQEEQLRSKYILNEETLLNPLAVKPFESLKFGIMDYVTKITNSSLFISLIEKEVMKGSESENLILSKEEGSDYIYYDDGIRIVQLWWDRKSSGRIRILADGREFIIVPDQEVKWKYEKGNKEEIMEYVPVLQKIAAVAADFDQAFLKPVKIPFLEEPADFAIITLEQLRLSAISNAEDPSCNGPQMTSDRFYAWTQLECCSMAEQDVNAKCSNYYCSGCCQLNECNWSGLWGGSE